MLPAGGRLQALMSLKGNTSTGLWAGVLAIFIP